MSPHTPRLPESFRKLPSCLPSLEVLTSEQVVRGGGGRGEKGAQRPVVPRSRWAHVGPANPRMGITGLVPVPECERCFCPCPARGLVTCRCFLQPWKGTMSLLMYGHVLSAWWPSPRRRGEAVGPRSRCGGSLYSMQGGRGARWTNQSSSRPLGPEAGRGVVSRELGGRSSLS